MGMEGGRGVLWDWLVSWGVGRGWLVGGFGRGLREGKGRDVLFGGEGEGGMCPGGRFGYFLRVVEGVERVALEGVVPIFF